MKKLMLGIVIGVAVSIPVSALAATVNLPWTNNIYNVSDVDKGRFSGSVSVFDDGQNKCYVARSTGGASQGGPDNIAISCLRQE